MFNAGCLPIHFIDHDRLLSYDGLRLGRPTCGMLGLLSCFLKLLHGLLEGRQSLLRGLVSSLQRLLIEGERSAKHPEVGLHPLAPHTLRRWLLPGCCSNFCISARVASAM